MIHSTSHTAIISGPSVSKMTLINEILFTNDKNPELIQLYLKKNTLQLNSRLTKCIILVIIYFSTRQTEFF